METNPVTGKPIGMMQQDREREAIISDHVAVSDAIEIERELKEEKGSAILEEIKRKLEQRIDVLSSNDPECKVLTQVLETFGTAMARGRDAAERIAKRSLRK